MFEIAIPGFGNCRLEHLVLDYNGTLAVDGELLAGVAAKLEALSTRITIHVVTADTFGVARKALAGLPCQLTIVDPLAQAQAKADYVERLGAQGVVCIGNGRNDRLMFEAAFLAIAVLQKEGASAQALAAADVVTSDIHDALDLLVNPKRLIASLRS
jgi:soluble P-type ATPase